MSNLIFHVQFSFTMQTQQSTMHLSCKSNTRFFINKKVFIYDWRETAKHEVAIIVGCKIAFYVALSGYTLLRRDFFIVTWAKKQQWRVTDRVPLPSWCLNAVILFNVALCCSFRMDRKRERKGIPFRSCFLGDDNNDGQDVMV